MILTFPEYFKKFVCTADKCTDTCCAGWDVVIDEESLEYYRNLDGDYGEKIRSLITVDEDGDSIFVSSGGRCPFLLESGLCDMYINLGHGCLSRTCRIFPRFTNAFGARAETGLSVSCPEAARLIFESENPVTFETEKTDGAIMPSDFDTDLYFTMLKVRKTAINILQDRKFSVAERLCAFLRYSEIVQDFVDFYEYENAEDISTDELFEKSEYSPARAKRALKGIFRFFSSAEFINPDYVSILSAAETVDMKGFAVNDKLIEHLAVYFLHRYYITAVYDGRVLEKAIFAVLCTLVIMRISAALGNEEFQVNAQKFSKEIEHSALNMEILIKAIRKSRCFSVENLINILSEKEI